MTATINNFFIDNNLNSIVAGKVKVEFLSSEDNKVRSFHGNVSKFDGLVNYIDVSVRDCDKSLKKS